MPEMNGYEAIKILKGKPETKNIPAIFLIAKTDMENELEGLDLGAIDYITKPFMPSLLLKRIEVHLLVEAQKKTLEAQQRELKNFNGNLQKSDRILQKPGRLNPEEFEEMKKHTTIGVQIIERIEASASDFLKYAKIFAGTHHEKWDGAGYPSGLAGEAIPLQGRIMALTNVYDALVSERPYKKAFSHAEAVKIIQEGRGTQFDPALTDVFIKVMEQ
jgi:response regulator RpfG family c-di-GMP phosphodiesterase